MRHEFQTNHGHQDHGYSRSRFFGGAGGGQCPCCRMEASRGKHPQRSTKKSKQTTLRTHRTGR